MWFYCLSPSAVALKSGKNAEAAFALASQLLKCQQSEQWWVLSYVTAGQQLAAAVEPRVLSCVTFMVTFMVAGHD